MPSPIKDARLKKTPRSQLGVENQSKVFAVFDEDTKLTVKDVHDRVNAKAREIQASDQLTERTVRRAIDALVSNGFLIPHGKIDNAVLYAKRSTSMTDEETGLIPFAGDLITVESFLSIMSNLESDPFKVKLSTLSVDAVLTLRRQMLFAIISSGEPGHTDQLKKVAKNLQILANELKHAHDIVKGLLDSPIWYDQYRDPIGYQVRQVQKRDPELYDTVTSLVKGN